MNLYGILAARDTEIERLRAALQLIRGQASDIYEARAIAQDALKPVLQEEPMGQHYHQPWSLP